MIRFVKIVTIKRNHLKYYIKSKKMGVTLAFIKLVK